MRVDAAITAPRNGQVGAPGQEKARNWRHKICKLTGIVVALVPTSVLPVLFGAATSQASTVSTLQAKANELATQIDGINAKIGVLDEEYDQAVAHQQSLGKAVQADNRSLSKAQSSVTIDGKRLKTEAVQAYVANGSGAGLSAVLSANAGTIATQQTYLNVASGSLVTAVATFTDAVHQLSSEKTTLTTAEQAAAKNTELVGASRAAAFNLQDRLNATLSGVKGQLGQLVAQQEQVRQQAAAVSAESIARAAATALPIAPVEPIAPSAPVPSGNGAAAAIAAARAVIGVPYQWAGSSPASGFDCSGLTMFAWSHAGVNLPHSAQAQYDSIEHVSLSDLQPGDLIFYASGGYIYHVIMYVGGGDAIQAENYGTTVAITPIMPGPYAAGRP